MKYLVGTCTPDKNNRLRPDRSESPYDNLPLVFSEKERAGLAFTSKNSVVVFMNLGSQFFLHDIMFFDEAALALAEVTRRLEALECPACKNGKNHKDCK